MSGRPRNLEDLFKLADSLQAKGKAFEAWRKLFYALDDHFFNEALHDRLGLSLWDRAEKFSQQKTSYNEAHRIMQRAEAGMHWILSGEDDERRNRWRNIVLTDFENDPESLFRALKFPELPFDRFSHPAVKARLDELHQQLALRGWTDERLSELLYKRRRKRVRDDVIGLLGCAFGIIVFFTVLIFAIVGFFSLIKH